MRHPTTHQFMLALMALIALEAAMVADTELARAATKQTYPEGTLFFWLMLLPIFLVVAAGFRWIGKKVSDYEVSHGHQRAIAFEHGRRMTGRKLDAAVTAAAVTAAAVAEASSEKQTR